MKIVEGETRRKGGRGGEKDGTKGNVAAGSPLKGKRGEVARRAPFCKKKKRKGREKGSGKNSALPKRGKKEIDHPL